MPLVKNIIIMIQTYVLDVMIIVYLVLQMRLIVAYHVLLDIVMPLMVGMVGITIGNIIFTRIV